MRKRLWALIVVGLVGLADSSYLTYRHFSLGGGRLLGCSILEGCEAVTSGAYSTVAGVPVALLGLFYYLAVLLLTVGWLRTKRDAILNFLLPLATIGVAASTWFVYLQVFVIKSICSYCLLSALTSALVLVLVVTIIIAKKKPA